MLLPVQDGNVADCRSPGVKFVRVQFELDFADLTIAAAANPAPNVVLRGEYYIQLPQSSRDLVNGTGGGIQAHVVAWPRRPPHAVHCRRPVQDP